jgi:hypothetical protein
MSDREEHPLTRFAGLSDPRMPAARSRHIQQLARQHFLAVDTKGAPANAAPLAAGGLAGAPTCALRPRTALDGLGLALMFAFACCYLIWTGATLGPLQKGAHSVLWERARLGASP